jgi:hypothetical protein
MRTSAVEWKLDAQGCACPRGALDNQGAAQRLDAVFQPDEPGAADRVGPAGSVVTDVEPDGTCDRLHLDIVATIRMSRSRVASASGEVLLRWRPALHYSAGTRSTLPQRIVQLPRPLPRSSCSGAGLSTTAVRDNFIIFSERTAVLAQVLATCRQCVVRVRHCIVSPHRERAQSGDGPGDGLQPYPGIRGTTTPF